MAKGRNSEVLKSWVNFVKSIQKEKGVSYKEAMVIAGKEKHRWNNPSKKGSSKKGGSVIDEVDEEISEMPDGEVDEVVEETQDGGRRRRRRHGTKKRRGGAPLVVGGRRGRSRKVRRSRRRRGGAVVPM